jgi:regulator of protease activity HflC (stomatin/prohibitin superfamily)
MSEEKEMLPSSGWGMLVLDIVFYLAVIPLFIMGGIIADGGQAVLGIALIFFAVLILLSAILVTIGFLVLPPNEAGVLVLFGKYVGTVKANGFWWVNPFTSKKKISLRARNLNGPKLKVNDRSGNPIEIAAVVVWKVQDTFEAMFEVDDYMGYVDTQSESAIRHLASSYPYDSWEDEEIELVTLRGSRDEVSDALQKELQERLGKAGVVVLEARLSHLAYAPEVAEAMLKRQQASAIVAARKKIVDGAVGMVEMALAQLSAKNVVELDEDRKAAMVSNLLVVLCGEKEASPVINTGTLYT